MGNRGKALCALLAAGMLALAGSGSATGIPALDREPAGTDQWPGDRQPVGESWHAIRVFSGHARQRLLLRRRIRQIEQKACLFKFARERSPQLADAAGPGTRMPSSR